MNRKTKYKPTDKPQRPHHRKTPLESVAWKGKIERLAWGGLGISHLEDGRALLLNAPLALFPNETVRATIRQKSKHAEGEVTAWLQPSPLRTVSKCHAAEKCGGCDLQESGPHHSTLKRSMVEDLFRRMLPNQPWEWLPAPEDALRHRIQLHWDGKTLGFHQRKRNTVVPINSCPAASPSISSAISRLEEALVCHILPSRPQRWELTAGTPPTYVFAIDEKQRTWVLEPDGWHKSEENVMHHYSGHRLIHKPGGFFQATAKWAMEAFCQVLSQWNIKGDTLYDLYGGVGLFSVILGTNFNKCTLVESDSSSIAFAELNLTEAKLHHQCIESDVAVWMPDCLGDTGDVVLLDPPRSGLAPEIVEKLLKSQASALILIGCDGAAFCRDIKRLGQIWGLKQLAVIDLFPMTVHVECIGLLQKNELATTS